MDKYIEMHKHPIIHTYLDYETNLTTHKYEFVPLREEKETAEEKIAFAKGHPLGFGYAMNNQQRMIGDNNIPEDLFKQTFWQWLREGFNKKKRTDSHRLAYTMLIGGPLFVLINVLIYAFLTPLKYAEHDKIHVNP